MIACGRELGPVVTAQRRWGAAESDRRFEMIGEPRDGDRTVDRPADAFAGVHDGADLDRSAAFVAVELEVDPARFGAAAVDGEAGCGAS